MAGERISRGVAIAIGRHHAAVRVKPLKLGVEANLLRARKF